MNARHVTTFSDAQVRALLASDLSPWWRAFVLVGMRCGLRPCEAARLQWGDLSAPPTASIAVRGCAACVVNVDGPSVGVGGVLPVFESRVSASRVRFVSMDAETWRALQVLWQRDSSPYVFLSAVWLHRCWPLYDRGTMPSLRSLLPGLNAEFARVQRVAASAVSSTEAVAWHPFPASALRGTWLARSRPPITSTPHQVQRRRGNSKRANHSGLIKMSLFQNAGAP